jgi:DNA-binding NarL/FixJ family response regulator
VDQAPIRVVLAEDDVLLREGLAQLLDQAGLVVAGRCSTAEELLSVVRRERPELAIVDIRMPPGQSTEGLDVSRVLRAEFPQMAILILSAHVEVEHAMELLAAGDRTGYLLKTRITDVDHFIDTLRRLVDGGTAVDPVVVQELIAMRRAVDPLEEITPREREVLALMAEGLSNSGIAHQLWVTEGTVEKHVRSILGKLQLPESTESHRRVLAVLRYLDAR